MQIFVTLQLLTYMPLILPANQHVSLLPYISSPLHLSPSTNNNNNKSRSPPKPNHQETHQPTKKLKVHTMGVSLVVWWPVCRDLIHMYKRHHPSLHFRQPTSFQNLSRKIQESLILWEMTAFKLSSFLQNFREKHLSFRRISQEKCCAGREEEL